MCYVSSSLSVWQACWPPVHNTIMQNTPFNGAGRRLAPHPFLANISFSYSNIVILSYLSALSGICICRVIQEYVAIHEKGNESKSTCSGCVGGPGRLPALSPLLRWRSCWGGGEGWRAGSCLGIWAGKGGSLASKPRVEMVGLSGE